MEPIDPAELQAEIEALKAQELDLVRETIKAPDRLERFVQLIGERDQLTAISREQIDTYYELMSALNADYDANHADMESAIRDYYERRLEVQREFIAIASAMKAETTAEEWKTIAKFQTGSLHPRLQAWRFKRP